MSPFKKLNQQLTIHPRAPSPTRKQINRVLENYTSENKVSDDRNLSPAIGDPTIPSISRGAPHTTSQVSAFRRAPRTGCSKQSHSDFRLGMVSSPFVSSAEARAKALSCAFKKRSTSNRSDGRSVGSGSASFGGLADAARTRPRRSNSDNRDRRALRGTDRVRVGCDGNRGFTWRRWIGINGLVHIKKWIDPGDIRAADRSAASAQRKPIFRAAEGERRD